MKQLEKKQQNNGTETDNLPQQQNKMAYTKNQMTAETNQNRKNVIENYFKIGGQTIDATQNQNVGHLIERGLTSSELENTQGLQATIQMRKQKLDRKSRDISAG